MSNPLYGPDRTLQAYLALRARIASCRAIIMDGMPQVDSDARGAERIRTKLSDLGWYAQDLSPLELRVAEARLLGYAGTEHDYRYITSISDVEPDEIFTGGAHPADPSMREVRGVRTRQPRYDELSKHLGIDVREIGQAVRSARSKVGRRLWQRRQQGDRLNRSGV